MILYQGWASPSSDGIRISCLGFSSRPAQEGHQATTEYASPLLSPGIYHIQISYNKLNIVEILFSS